MLVSINSVYIWGFYLESVANTGTLHTVPPQTNSKFSMFTPNFKTDEMICKNQNSR